MAYLNPRYNGRVGVYRTNEIERFGLNDLYLEYPNSSAYPPIYSITEDSNRVYILMGDSGTYSNLVRTYSPDFTESYTFSCTASVTLRSIYSASDGWLYATGATNTKILIAQMTVTGSQYRELWSNTSSSRQIDFDMVENNNRIYVFTDTSAAEIQVISASGSSSSVVSTIALSGYFGMKPVSVGSYVYYVGQRRVSGSQIQVLKISATSSSVLSSPYYTQILNFPTTTNEAVLNADTNGTDILISYDAGSNYPASATASFLLSFDISSESFTPKIRTDYYDKVYNVSYSTSNSSYYYDRWVGTNPATYSVNQTFDEVSSTTPFTTTSIYLSGSLDLKYSNLFGSVVSVYNSLTAGSFPQYTTVRLIP